MPTASVDVAKLGTAVLEKFKAAIDRGHHLPGALKDMTTDELRALRTEIDETLKNRGVIGLENRTPARVFTPRTA